MHTSAPTSAHRAPDARLFDDVPLQYTGTLLHQAQVRTAVLDGDGHTVPVLCFDIELDCPFRNHFHGQQAFQMGQWEQASIAAHRLKKGTKVSVDAALIGLQLVANNVSHIHILTAAHAASPQEPAAPCPK